MIDKGGSAFPGEVLDYCEATIFSGEIRPVYKKASGMTLRDYFAGQALAGLAVQYTKVEGYFEACNAGIAVTAYAIADAMIARGKE